MLGSGDRALACAAFAQFDGLRDSWCANERQSTHFRKWARPFHDAVRGHVGCVDGPVFHLWHGHRDDRRYVGDYFHARREDG